MDGGAATAEWIKHDIAFVAAGFDDAFQKCERLLRRVAERLRAGRNLDVVPKITDGNPFLFVKITLESGNSLSSFRHDNQTLGIGFKHPTFCPTPDFCDTLKFIGKIWPVRIWIEQRGQLIASAIRVGQTVLLGGFFKIVLRVNRIP